MTRLIDADKLKEAHPMAGYYGYKQDDIDEMPTVTLWPDERKGYWQFAGTIPNWVTCSLCQKRFLPNREWIEVYKIPTNYCPNCGAKMEGVNDAGSF